METKKKQFKMPHTFVIIGIIILFAVLLTWIIPAGSYTRFENEAGIKVIDPNDFNYIDKTPVNPLEIPLYIVKAFIKRIDLMLVIMFAGGAFHILTKTGALHAVVAKMAKIFSTRVYLFLPILTLVFGPKLLGDRSYYAVSLLMVLEAMLPFFLTFEGRNPRARELVVTAVLCALGVAGRAAFFMLPQCKPVLALTILAGAALGGETGFLVGAATMLVSNILFSQGPWTPWQMLGMGLCGFLAGLVFHRGRAPRNRGTLCVFGVVSAFAVYGILLNAYSALLATGALTWQSLAVYCASGFAMDAVQAISTVIFLWFFTEPMLDKLERVKIKYGFA